jgi:uncharacterized protein YggE
MIKKILLVLLLLCFAAVYSPALDSSLRLITVRGEAEVKVVPDEVIITIGIETSNKILSAAKNENDRVVKSVLAIAKKQDIDPKYVQTDYFTIAPRYDYQYADKLRDRQMIFAGYFVRKNVVITLKDISRYEDLLSGILESGVNYIQGIQFRTTELRKYRDQVRVMAVKAAKEKAELLARELGVKTGKPSAVTEDYDGFYSWNNNQLWDNRQNGLLDKNTMANAGGGNPPEDSSIAPGQISVSAHVTVIFELE